ncbi:CapA family protein [Pseudoalteromonas sp. MMG012]|uniref:CapA family protein n=1 Tax=Pseudoalteromonas sp. MMG012 TaxID=2822686 RepID=UPI001B3A37F2|nr:CapA family protein [Pseudoalteromonas sp. MMG012]MBQ4852095.1 CapA family protein [Pseudoalteromonas sp. MMG012]
MNIKITQTILILVTYWLSSVVYAVELKGFTLSTKANPISDVIVTISGNRIKSDKNGKFSLSLAPQKRYRLEINKHGYYQTIHTFEHTELARYNFTIPPIEVVKKKPGRVMFAFAGDTMMGRRYYAPYFNESPLIQQSRRLQDSKNLLETIKPYLSLADFTSVNLESPIIESLPSTSAEKSVTFYSHPDTLASLSWAGVDYVSLGNNHTYDYLQTGLKQTLTLLKSSPLAFSGAGINEAQALQPHIAKLANNKYALYGFVGWKGRKPPWQSATPVQGGAALGNPDNIAAVIEQSVKSNVFPVIQYHGGLEYSHTPSLVTEQRLKNAIDKGAVLAIGHHPHVTQGFEVYNNQFIAYSLGNFMFDRNFPATHNSVLVYVWLDQGQFFRAETVPLFIQNYSPTPAVGQQRFTVLKRLKQLSAVKGTNIVRSGGHGVINRSSVSVLSAVENNQALHTQNTIQNLYQNNDWDKPLPLSLPTHSALRYGTNIVNSGDFESYSDWSAIDRTWIFHNTEAKLRTQQNFNQYLRLSFGGDHITFGTKHFNRVYIPDNPTSLRVKLRALSNVKISAYWQGRQLKQTLQAAFMNPTTELIDSKTLAASAHWQTLRFDFNSPRVGYKSYRIKFVIESKLGTQLGSSHYIDIDDIELVQWQSAFSKVLHNTSALIQTTHREVK